MKISENFFINLFNLVGIFSTPSQTHNLCSSASSPIYINLVSISKMWDCIPIIRSCHLKLRWAVVTGEGAAVQCQCLDRAVQAWPLGPHPDPRCTQPPSSTNREHSHCALQTTDLLGSQQIWRRKHEKLLSGWCYGFGVSEEKFSHILIV